MSERYPIEAEPPRPGMSSHEAQVAGLIKARRGRERPIGRAELAEAAGLPDRSMRRIIGRLVEVFGLPICSSYESGGYYWPASQEDIDRTRRKLRGHALSILVRQSRLGRTSRRMRDIIEQLRLEVQR